MSYQNPVNLDSNFLLLELLNVEVGNKGRELFPVKALSKLESWTPLTISDFMVKHTTLIIKDTYR